MKLPRGISGRKVIKTLEKLGYIVARRKGSHVILIGPNGKMIVVPLHNELKTGLLRGVIKETGISVKLFKELLKDP